MARRGAVARLFLQPDMDGVKLFVAL